MNDKKYTKADILEIEVKNLVKTNTNEHQVILEQIVGVNEKLDEAFVTKIEFTPIKNVVYGLVGISLTAVVVALVRLVLIQ